MRRVSSAVGSASAGTDLGFQLHVEFDTVLERNDENKSWNSSQKSTHKQDAKNTPITPLNTKTSIIVIFEQYYTKLTGKQPWRNDAKTPMMRKHTDEKKHASQQSPTHHKTELKQSH